ncbi:insulinase family protein [Clostridium hydrogenum]|uniref:insulinase family protein n=1 Tax=Clostridium hydrogenum TaxID=2855764 RepID=UPI001F1ADF09|nr:insulinase family protein [Clostridium hydrogenum]
MNLDLNSIIHGFRVTNAREFKELDATMYEMIHEKTAAELVWLKTSDSNKLFSIAFKTIPTNDTGVFHILEHSVLCGSKKYPVKEPFVELLKSSMNTFLNAMTYPDKTLYPVSSRNDKDFINLAKVYLDAVFEPAIYENPNIFYQEGWHYEINDKAENPIYKGVVFNEMKGAYSSVYTSIMSDINRMLFPDNCYQYVSGGEPEKIPDLTYKEFIEAHSAYYHPSNSRIYLDGDVNIEQILSLLDQEYLCKYEKKDEKFEIKVQEPIKFNEKVHYYEISQEEALEGKSHMTLGKIVGTWEEREKLLAISVLAEYLIGSNDSPMKKAILQKQLGQDVSIQLIEWVLQPYMLLQVWNTDYEKKDEIKETIKNTILTIVKNGISVKDLEAVINQKEFKCKESSEPRAITNNINVLKSWLYGGDPALYLTYKDIFKSLREKLTTDYFVKLAEQLFLEDDTTAVLYSLPSKTLGEEKRKKEEEKLINIKNCWDKDKLEEIINLNNKLQEWQRLSDTKDKLNTIPKLNLSEVNLLPEKRETEVYAEENVKVLFHSSLAKGVIYLNLYFSLADFEFDKLTSLAFMSKLFGELPTKNNNLEELKRDIKTNLGNLDFGIEVFSKPGNIENCNPYFVVKCSVLEEKFQDAIRIIKEVLTETKFDQDNKIKEILQQMDEGLRQEIITSGHMYSIKRAAAHFSAEGAVAEAIEGYSFYEWIHGFVQKYETDKDKFIQFVSASQKQIFINSHLVVSVTASEKVREISQLVSVFPKGSIEKECMKVVLQTTKKEGIQIPAEISYSALCSNLYKCGYDYSAGLKVLSNILSLSYLWNEIRVQGGAYGTGFSVSKTGDLMFYSYRDPNAARSLSIYRSASKYIREFCESVDKLDEFIIGSIAKTEPLLSPKALGALADSEYFRAISYEDRCKDRSEMLGVNKDKLIGYLNILETIANENAVCVVGHVQALKNCEKEELKIMNI